MRSSFVAILILSATTFAHAGRGGYYAGSDQDYRRANRDFAQRVTLANSNSPGWYTASYGVTYARATAGGRLGVVSSGGQSEAPRFFMAPNALQRPYPGRVTPNQAVWALTHATHAELVKALGPKRAGILDQARTSGMLTTNAAIEALPGIGKATVGRLGILAWNYATR